MSNRFGQKSGEHLVSGSRLMPRWEDRSGIAIQESRVNLLPKNEAQSNVRPLFFDFEEPYQMHALIYKQVLASEYFKALYIMKTFEKVLEVIEKNVRYVEPWAEAATRRPSSAYCLLVKLFTLKLTENQVNTMLDHENTYVRAMAALYLRYGASTLHKDMLDTFLWRWLGPYCDDLEEFSPSSTAMTFGEFLRRLLSSTQFYSTQLPKLPLTCERNLKIKLFLLDESMSRAAKNNIKVGDEVMAIFEPDEFDESPKISEWQEATVAVKIPPYERAPAGTPPQFKVKFKEGAIRIVKQGDIILRPHEDDSEEDRHRKKRPRSEDRHRERRPEDRHRRKKRSRPDLPVHGESILRGRDIMADILRQERQLAVEDDRKYSQKPLGYNTALIVAPDRPSYTHTKKRQHRSNN